MNFSEIKFLFISFVRRNSKIIFNYFVPNYLTRRVSFISLAFVNHFLLLGVSAQCMFEVVNI